MSQHALQSFTPGTLTILPLFPRFMAETLLILSRIFPSHTEKEAMSSSFYDRTLTLTCCTKDALCPPVPVLVSDSQKVP